MHVDIFVEDWKRCGNSFKVLKLEKGKNTLRNIALPLDPDWDLTQMKMSFLFTNRFKIKYVLKEDNFK